MKDKKDKKKIIIVVVTILSIFILLSVYEYAKSKAELKYKSEEISYNNTTSRLQANNVKDALDEINAQVEGTSYTVQNKTDFSNSNNNNSNTSSVKEVTGEEKEQIKKKFSELDDVVVMEISLGESEKGKDKEYKIDLPEGYSTNDNIAVYAYIDGEKIVIPYRIENGKIVFKTSLEGKFVIGKKLSSTNTSNQTGNIYNPKTGDMNLKGIITLLTLSTVVAITSLIMIIKGGLRNAKNNK